MNAVVALAACVIELALAVRAASTGVFATILAVPRMATSQIRLIRRRRVNVVVGIRRQRITGGSDDDCKDECDGKQLRQRHVGGKFCKYLGEVCVW